MEQGSKEWKAYRRNKIGASDAPVIMGVSPYSTPLQLWEEKALGKERAETYAMRFGKEREEFVRQMANDKFGKTFLPDVIESKELPWMIASLDGICGNSMIEIKCANEKDHECAAQKKVPTHYVPQVQHQLFVARLDSMFYLSYHKDDLQIVEVQKDVEYQSRMLELEREFFDRIVTLSAPPACDRDRIKIEEEWFLREMKAMEEFKRLEIENKDRRERLLDYVKSLGRDVETTLGRITKSFVQGAVQYNKIPQLAGVDLDSYRKNGFDKYTFTFNGGGSD